VKALRPRLSSTPCPGLQPSQCWWNCRVCVCPWCPSRSASAPCRSAWGRLRLLTPVVCHCSCPAATVCWSQPTTRISHQRIQLSWRSRPALWTVCPPCSRPHSRSWLRCPDCWLWSCRSWLSWGVWTWMRGSSWGGWSRCPFRCCWPGSGCR